MNQSISLENDLNIERRQKVRASLVTFRVNKMILKKGMMFKSEHSNLCKQNCNWYPIDMNCFVLGFSSIPYTCFEPT